MITNNRLFRILERLDQDILGTRCMFINLQINNTKAIVYYLLGYMIYQKKEEFAEQNKIKTDHKLWPKSLNVLTRRLDQIRSNLLEGLGISITVERNTAGKNKKKNTSSINIWKISPLPPLPPLDQNYEENQDKNGGGILDSRGIISPPEKRKITLKKAESRGSGYSGGIFPNSLEGRGKEGQEYRLLK